MNLDAKKGHVNMLKRVITNSFKDNFKNSNDRKKDISNAKK